MFIKFMDVFVIRFRQKLPHFNFWGESQIVNPNTKVCTLNFLVGFGPDACCQYSKPES